MKQLTIKELVIAHPQAASILHGVMPSDTILRAVKGEAGFLLDMGSNSHWTAGELEAVAAELKALNSYFDKVLNG